MNNKCTYSLYKKNIAGAKGKQLARGHQYFIMPGESNITQVISQYLREIEELNFDR